MAGRELSWFMTKSQYEKYSVVMSQLARLDPDCDDDADEYEDLKSELTRLPGFPPGTDEDDHFIIEILSLH